MAVWTGVESGCSFPGSVKQSSSKSGSQVSVQQVVDCTWGHSSYACQGGRADDEFWWFVNRSMPVFAEADYPYLGVSGTGRRYVSDGPFRPIGNITGCW
jgi:hypothetical protein